MARRTRASDPTKKERPKPSPVESRFVAHPTVWKTALRIAEGRVERITVEAYGRVSITLR